ncbi:MAG TPA: CAP domain-containing protein [Candidatus Ozemobacteraceae bacterium]|nr:CAP domain-containing protein [Candidatus Ozemobacteraceae bacterium]
MKTRTKLVAGIAVLVSVTLCSETALAGRKWSEKWRARVKKVFDTVATGSAPVATKSGGVSASRGIVEELLALHNRERARAGAEALSLDERLCRAAQAHAQDMARNDRLDHTGSDGSNFWARIVKTGYDVTAGAENVAMGMNTSAEAVDCWMSSAGHRGNILNRKYRHAGFGFADSPNGDRYWCGVFGKE